MNVQWQKQLTKSLQKSYRLASEKWKIKISMLRNTNYSNKKKNKKNLSGFVF